jgi:DNA-binding CsgD family transcriptional regulator
MDSKTVGMLQDPMTVPAHDSEETTNGISSSSMDTPRARRLLACAVAGGDVSEGGIHRFAGVTIVEARRAFDLCRQVGLVDPSLSVEQMVAISLIDDLPSEELAEIRSKAARSWMAVGPSHFLHEIERARNLGGLLPLDEIVELSDRAGHMSLSLHDYETATRLFQLALEFDVSGEPLLVAQRMRALASALDGLGQVGEARETLARAATLGYVGGDCEIVVSASVQYALPADWYAGDSRAIALLDRAASMDLSDADDVRVLAARSLVEMRIPITPTSDQQVAWVTRPQVAHALADAALERAATHSPEVRALAALAWRTTHRDPEDLDKRREVSRESLNLAQMLRLPTYQVESAVWLAVDAIESSDRPLYDEALSVARWVAERDGNPRLIWRAHTLACGSAHMEGDLDEAERWRLRAREVGQAISSPGWLAADLLLVGQMVVFARNPRLTSENLLPEDSPALVNPIGRAVAALLHAEVGNSATAERMIRKSLRQIDPESSYLLLATRCADVALRLCSVQIAEDIVSILAPWRGRVAVDSNGWWIDGPVDMWLGLLLNLSGHTDEASDCLEDAERIAKSLGDTRSLQRIADSRSIVLRANQMSTDPVSRGSVLTDRQQTILTLMSEGMTNHEIADHLSYSTSTIRSESMTIYKALGVKGRAEAIAWFAKHSSA